MRHVRISLVDLNSSSRIRSVQQLQSLFESDKAYVQVHNESELHALLESCAGTCGSMGNTLPDVIFIIIPKTFNEASRAVIQKFSSKPERIPIIAVLEDTETEGIAELFKIGVMDFITPPFRKIDVMPRIWRLTEYVRKEGHSTEHLKKTMGLNQLIGSSPLFIAEVHKIPFIARCDSSVFISGETGTGKEMCARAVHYLGPRAGKPFIPLNCGAIPNELIENELFGHARGAFTSASTSADGIIQDADGGTLFLDEIDCLTLQAQIKLLRLLQEKEYRQLGSAKIRRADVRIIAATNVDIEQAVDDGRFRRDLFYRVNILPLRLPPLRERREDIPLLARYFVEQYSLKFEKKIEGIGKDAEQKLVLYDWPGNVRELQNVIERGVVFSTSGVLQKNDINLPGRDTASPSDSFQKAKAKVVAEFEKNYLRSTLAIHRGNISQAARTAGKNRRAFWELIRKHEIELEHFRVSK